VGELDELHSGDPRRIGPYWLEGRLGSGGMGRVYLGRSPGGRYVAIKAIRVELAENAEFRARFAREVSAARKVSGIFTAPVVDADLDGPVPWLATSFVAGSSLAEAVAASGPLPVDSVLRLAAGLAEGLQAIHSAGVIHRDLKPSNVMLAGDGPRILDFGISQSAEMSALTGIGTVVGSPGFMSPEQAEGREVGPSSDIFSLGAVLAFAATGEGPFGDGTTAALLYRVVHGEPGTGRLPEELRPLIERCLAKDPQHRPTAAQLLAELSNAQPGAHLLLGPATGGPPGHGPARPAPDEAAGAAAPLTHPATERAALPDMPVMAAATDAAGAGAASPGRPHPGGHAHPQAPGSPGSAGSRGRPGRFSRTALIGILAIAVLALSGTVAVLTLTAAPSPAAVTLEPVGSPGPDPFMPSAGTDQSGRTRLVGSGGTFSGGTPGLYGGTMRKASCKPQQMVSFLRVHPGKAAAWASVLGIRPAGIPRYVASLTPVVLRSDTAVTNHGYIDGHVTSFPAILEAGTAVLINRHGEPVTKCFCGNPLTKPMAYTRVTYTGQRWPSFSAASVTYIQPATAPVKSFTLVDPATGRAFRRPPGSIGNLDQPVSTPPTGPLTSKPTPTATSSSPTPTATSPTPTSAPTPPSPTPTPPSPTPAPTLAVTTPAGPGPSP
jgi:hypothetical protein